MNNLAENQAANQLIRQLTQQLQTLMQEADDPVRLSEPEWSID